MSVHFIDGGQTLLVGGPAKVNLTADDPPIAAARPTPTLSAIAPITAEAGSGDFVLTATGTNYSQFSKIVIGGSDMPTTYVSPTSLTCVVDARKFAAGTQDVKVRNGSLITAPQTLTFTEP